MRDGRDLGGFLIVCPDCQKNEKVHHTMLYVDWENGLYVIQCETCEKIVYFDFQGRQVPPGLARGMRNRDLLN